MVGNSRNFGGLKKSNNFFILLPCLFIVGEWILFYFLKKDQAWVSGFYINKIFLPISFGLRNWTNHFSIHSGFIFAIIILVLLLFQVFKNLLKKRFWQAITMLLWTIVIIYPIYMLMWGLVYYKKEAIVDDKNPVTHQEIVDLTKQFINLSKAYNNDNIKQKNYKTIENLAWQNSKNLQNYSDKAISVKTGAFSSTLASMGTSGIYSFWSGEVFVSNLHINTALPFVMCHEMAHAMGTGPEEMANFNAYQACINSNDSLFQYSAIREVIQYGLNAIAMEDSTLAYQLKDSLSTFVLEDFKKEKKAWEPYRNGIFRNISNIIYDRFLKFNGQKNGQKSYAKLLELIVMRKRKYGFY